MANYGTVALVLLFSISFALYVGSGGEYASNFMLLIQELNKPGVNIWNAVLDSILSPEILIGTVATIAAAGLSSYSVTYTIPALILGVIANYVLFPLSFLSDTGMPTELGWLIFGLLNLLLITALISFIRGKDL